MELTEEQIKKMDKETLFTYFTTDYPDEEYREIVSLLFGYYDEKGKTGEDILKFCIDNGKTLDVAYDGAEVPSGATPLISVNDGMLYYT